MCDIYICMNLWGVVVLEHRASVTSTTVPRPSIEHITFLCRADTIRVMPRTRVGSGLNIITITELKFYRFVFYLSNATTTSYPFKTI